MMAGTPSAVQARFITGSPVDCNPNGAGLPTWTRYDPGKDLIFEFHPDGTAGAIPDSWKPRLDVMQKATESGKRAEF